MKTIGLIHSPFKNIKDMPIQSVRANNFEGYIEIFPEFVDGLKDLDGFSHLYAIYRFHKNRKFSLLVKPFLVNSKKGVFATRAPRRPNPIGLSIFKIKSMRKEKIFIYGVDALDGTPLLDLKPFVSEFDNINNTKNGWLEKVMYKSKNFKSDRRFD